MTVEVETMEKSVKVPGWLVGLVSLGVVACGTVSWAYSTFVTIRERDVLRIANSERLESIEKKQDAMNEKLDRIIEKLLFKK